MTAIEQATAELLTHGSTCTCANAIACQTHTEWLSVHIKHLELGLEYVPLNESMVGVAMRIMFEHKNNEVYLNEILKSMQTWYEVYEYQG